MTQEEYRARTLIQTPEEAKTRLVHLQELFFAVFGARIFISLSVGFVTLDVYRFLLLAHVTLIVYFVIYCMKVIKLTRDVTRADLVWSILFAPISWLWFYPEITKPLRIILGELPPPDKLPTREERAALRKAVNGNYWKSLLIIVGLCFLCMAVLIGWLVLTAGK